MTFRLVVPIIESLTSNWASQAFSGVYEYSVYLSCLYAINHYAKASRVPYFVPPMKNDWLIQQNLHTFFFSALEILALCARVEMDIAFKSG